MRRQVQKGDYIQIIEMKGEPQYAGQEGYVTHIDDAGQIHGTWGGCAVIPGTDSYKVIEKSKGVEGEDTNVLTKASGDTE